MRSIKQKVALLLVMLMVFTQTIPVFAQVKPLLISQKQAVYLENGKDVEVSLQATNKSNIAQEAYLIMALYNEQTNEMVTYNYVTDQIEPGQTKDWGVDIPIPEEGIYKIKAFAWDNLTLPTLMSNVLEIKEQGVEEGNYKKILQETSAYLAAQVPATINAIGAEWSVFGLARSEYPVGDTYYADYFNRLVGDIEKELVSSRPFGGKVTEVQRIVIALTAMGKDASNINGVDLFDYTWNKQAHFPMLKPPMNELGGMQGLNELLYGLITIDLLGAEAPEDTTITREQIINKIFEYHKADGGFALNQSAVGSDVDITAMTIQALAPYYDINNGVKVVVNQSLEWLSSKQTESGGFDSEFISSSESSESTAQVIVALSALGIDVTKDERFIKGENNPLTNLLSYYAGGGKFKHTADGEANMMGTEQCHYALVAYDRLVKEKTSLYDMSDVVLEGEGVQVLLNIDRSSIASDEILLHMGYNEKLAEAMSVIVPEGSHIIDVLNTIIEDKGIEITMESSQYGSYVTAIDGIYGGGTAQFQELCEQLGLEIIPDSFAMAGWMFSVNGQIPALGVDTQPVKQGDRIEFRMSVYSGPDAEGNWVNYDWEFIDAYEDLKELITSIDESKYTGEALENLKAAVSQATEIIEAIELEAQGKWLTYIGTKQESLYGSGSPSESLKSAYVMLQQAIDKVPVVGKVQLAIEKRTIGKGDTLSMKTVPLYMEDTVWDITKRTMDLEGIKYEFAGTEANNNIYLSSIDGDGEFDYGSGSGWKYEVDSIFPNDGISQYKPVDGDIIRLRYCVTTSSEEFNHPLIKLLEQYVEKAREYRATEYTAESYAKLARIIEEAASMINDPTNNSQETSIELKVSRVIGKIIEGINGLEKRDDIVTPPSEILPDFENNISLNKDFLKMQIGDTYQITARRLQEIIDNFNENNITHPNYHYEVVSGDSVAVDTKGMVTANKIGTSIIAVTYDAVSAHGKEYGAISPINTGLFVVNVTDGVDTGIQITLENKEGHVIQQTRSYDTFYYTGNNFEYSFAVKATNSNAVDVFVNGIKVEAQNGIYTAALGNSGNIIKVIATNEKGSEVFAQVVDARKVEITIQNMTDPERDDEIRVDDKVRVKFQGITLPVYKLATIYNPSFYDPNWDSLGNTAGAKVVYACDATGEDMYGKISQYDLSKDNAIEFVAQQEGIYNFTLGHIDEGWWGEPLGTEKEMTGPGNDNIWAAHYHDKFSQLPDFRIAVGKKIFIPIEKIEIINAPQQLETISQPYQLETKLYPRNATQQKHTWTSSNEEVLVVDENGKVTPVDVGIATVTVEVAAIEGTEQVKQQAVCTINIIPELPATPEEREGLMKTIVEAKEKDESRYTKQSWANFQEALSKAEAAYSNGAALLKDITEARNELYRAMRALILDPSIGVTTPSSIMVGDQVTIYFPNLQVPDYDEFVTGHQMYNVYTSDIPGLETIKSDNGYVASYEVDAKILRTLTFKVPESTTPGVYTLSNGRIEANSSRPPGPWGPPGYNPETYYEGIMPEIKLYIQPRTKNVFVYYSDRNGVNKLLGSAVMNYRGYKYY